jgi:transposase
VLEPQTQKSRTHRHVEELSDTRNPRYRPSAMPTGSSSLRATCEIQTVIADAGHKRRKLARELMRQNGWKLQIVKRRERAFKITGLTWIVERSFAWLGRNRRLSKDCEDTLIQRL